MTTLLVANIVGTRPQLIKAAPVSRALSLAGCAELLVNTGQHTDPDLDARIAAGVGLRSPDVHLGVGGGSHGVQTARMLEAVEHLLVEHRPDVVVTYGDTNSTLAAVLAATKLTLPTAHVEAGLRSFDRTMPEELNRVAADHLCDLLLAPTTTAMAQLEREGLGDRALPHRGCHGRRAQRRRPQRRRATGWAADRFYLATIHRAANTDRAERLRSVMAALGSLDAPVHLLVHPRLAERLARFGIEPSGAVVPHAPLPHAELLAVVEAADRVVTDSGGVQKEAFLLGTPCVTLRSRTEWPETLDGGWNVVAGDVLDRLGALLRRRPTQPRGAPFGDGSAAERIVAALQEMVA